MKKILLTIIAAASILTACDRSTEIPEVPSTGNVLVLNNGNWGSNDASITLYDTETGEIKANAFQKANGQNLGDLGQDMICLGEQVYIAVNGSQTIFVTGADLKIRQQINTEKNGTRLSPRYFTTLGNKVYVTYYEGYVGEISSDYSVRICPVGPNPEGIAVAGQGLYVANSGGMAYPAYNNTVSVVDASGFSETSVIEVNVNPVKVEASSDGLYVYVLSFGNYTDCPAMLQVIDTSTREVSALNYTSVSAMAKGGDDVLYILCGGYDQDWNPLPGTVYKHDMKTNAPLGTFVTDGTLLSDAYSISVTPDGYVYVGCSDYTTTGDVYVFTPSGKLHDKFDSQGINPLKAIQVLR